MQMRPNLGQALMKLRVIKIKCIATVMRSLSTDAHEADLGQKWNFEKAEMLQAVVRILVTNADAAESDTAEKARQLCTSTTPAPVACLCD